MNPLIHLFGRSPFTPLGKHMEEVSGCIEELHKLFHAIDQKNFPAAEAHAEKISKKEHQADLIKNDIRLHLPKRLFLPIDRENLLEILSIQDSIADRAEDAAVLATLKPLEIFDFFRKDFFDFLKHNISTFQSALLVVKELHDLLESTFGGMEAEKVRHMVDQVAYQEHETELIQRKLLKGFIQEEHQMTYATFYLWQRIFEAFSAISNLSENLANRVRMTLEN